MKDVNHMIIVFGITFIVSFFIIIIGFIVEKIADHIKMKKDVKINKLYWVFDDFMFTFHRLGISMITTHLRHQEMHERLVKKL